MTREEHLAQRMKSWKFRLWYRWYGLLHSAIQGVGQLVCRTERIIRYQSMCEAVTKGGSK